jgi:protein required for attachment to host cells
MSYIWVLVAESSRAKLYSAENRKAPLVEIGALVHPEARLHEGDLVSDQSGSDGGSVGQGRHVLDNKTNARDTEKTEFAKNLAHRLEAARKEKAFNRVVLIAPPSFLGLLRDNLSDQVMELVTEQIDKNLVQQPACEVREHLSWPQ